MQICDLRDVSVGCEVREELFDRLEEVGAAVVMVEKDLSVDNAVAQIGSLMADAATLGQMAVSAREQGHLDTAQQVASLLGKQFLNHQ